MREEIKGWGSSDGRAGVDIYKRIVKLWGSSILSPTAN